MADTNYSEVGSGISDLVQKAIDEQDFGSLSTAIQNTVGTTVRQSMSAVGDGINRAADLASGRGQAADSGNVPYWKQPNHERAAAQQPWKSGKAAGSGAASASGEGLYSSGGSSRMAGYLMLILGLAGFFGMLAVLLMVSVAGALANLGLKPMKGILLILALGFAFLSWRGFRTVALVRKFQNYVKILGARTSISIKDLANANGCSEKETQKDVSAMLEKRMFLQGHLDDGRTTLFVTNESYEAYSSSRRQSQAQKEEQMRERQRSQKARSALPEEVRKLIEDGDGYIQKIRESNEAIQDPAVSEKLDGLEAVTRKIFEYVESHPESAGETRKLMRYYLPTTMKLLDAYRSLTKEQTEGLHPDQNSNMEESKKQIEETLDTLNVAFARLFDQMYQDSSMEINADISVLKTLLAKEGLTESEAEQAMKGVK